MNIPLTRELARKGKAVYLRQDLPMGFGNRYPIHQNPYAPGYIKSDGFENGQVKVIFRLYVGEEQCEFNPGSAITYLECSPW